MSILSHLSRVLFSLWQQRHISGPQRKFVLHLLQLWPAVSGRYNAFHLSPWSHYHEQTIRRHLAKAFPWARFYAALLQETLPTKHELILAKDARFIRKSGKGAPGLGHFYNGCAQRVEKGLELSLISAVDLPHNTPYAPGQTHYKRAIGV